MTTSLKQLFVGLMVLGALATSTVSIRSPSVEAQMGPIGSTMADWCDPSSPYANQAACRMAGGVWNGPSTLPTMTVSDWCNPSSPYAGQGACQMAGGVWRGPSTLPTMTVSDWCNPSSPYANQGACQMAGGVWRGTDSKPSSSTSPMTPSSTVADWCNPSSPYASQGTCQMAGGLWGGTNVPTATNPCSGAPFNSLCTQSPAANSIFCASQPGVCTPQFCQVAVQLCGNVAHQTSVVQVNTSTSTLGCSGTTSVVIAVGSSNNQAAPNGTAVTLSASSGQITPSFGATSGGTVTALYTAPATPGPATITASAQGASGTKSVTVNCTTPPSAGDGGLASALYTETRPGNS